MERSSTIAELMERRRIQAGAKEYKGHTYMDLARFDEATKHMIIFIIRHPLTAHGSSTTSFFPVWRFKS